jgi:hypothetical protein
MKLIKLSISQWFVLALLIVAGFCLTQLLHHRIDDGALRFAIFVPSVFAMLLFYFRYVAPARPFDLAMTLAVVLGSATAILIFVKDFTIDRNYSHRPLLVLCVVEAAPFVAAAVYNLFRREQ